jgi:amino acid transporter
LPSIYQGANLSLIFGISIVLLLTLAYNVTSLTSAMPRAGGDYVFGSRVVHPVWGMIPSFMVLFSFVVGIGVLVVVDLQAFLGPAILTSYPQYLNTVLNLFYLNPLNLFVISAVTLILIFSLAIVSTRAWFWFVRVVSVFAILTFLVFLGYLLTTNHQTIASNFDGQLSTGLKYAQVAVNATAAGWSPNVSVSPLTTAGAMIFVFFFLAAPIAAYYGSEIKSTSRSMAIGVLGGTVIAWIIAAVGVLAIVSAFTYDFVSAFGFLSLSNPSAFNVNALVLSVVGDPNVAFLIGLGFALATLGLVAAPILPASRLLLAWSFDRVLPRRFANVSDRTHTPIFSLGVVALLTVIVAGVESYYASALGAFVATTIIVAIAFLPNGVTAALLPFRRKEIYDSAPRIVTRKVGGVPLVSITGLIHAVGLGAIIVLVFLNPAAAGTSNGIIGTGALLTIIAGLIAAIAIYPIARAIRRSSGMDLDMVFKELPPE